MDADGRTYDDDGEYFFDCTQQSKATVAATKMKPNKPDYEKLRPLFGWAPADIIRQTYLKTTRYAWTVLHYPFRKHFKTRFPAANIHRRNEPVATNTVFSDTPAIPGGHKCAQLFFGVKTFVTDCYPMKTDAEFVNTLEDNIRERGAMTS